jgi:processing peptidase subunit alpha
MFASSTGEEGTPLNIPLAGVEVASSGAPVAASTQLTTLPNGLKVVSENTPGATTCIGVFVGAGSRSETDANAGVTHLLEHMAFKTTDSRSHFRTVHEVEHLGANLVAQAGREELTYSAEILGEHAPAVLEIMADTIQNPDFKAHEVAEQKEIIGVDIQEAQMNTNNLTTEAAHLAAYGNTGLGRSLMASPKGLGNLTPDVLKAHVAETLVAGNVVVAAAGVDHTEFVGQVENLFSGLPAGAAPAVEAAKYVGGSYHVPTETFDGLSHVVLGFEGPSWHDAELIPMCVLHTLMGGGSSFSAGGPGKGMYSRLYTGVLNKHGWVQNATAFNSCYADSGLFGIYGAAEARHLPNLVQVLAEQLKGMGGAVTDEELSRAKKMTKSSVLMNLESKPIILEDMGKQVLCYGKRLTAAEVCSQIDSVSAADIAKVAKKMMGSPLTYAGLGEVHSLPRYDMVSQFFK